jgi:5'-nucleotidase
MDWSRNACLNINFPACDADRVGPLTLTRQGIGLLESIEVVSRTDPRNLTYHWLRLHRAARHDADESETAAIAAGKVSVTPLRFERTHDETLAQLQQELGERDER